MRSATRCKDHPSQPPRGGPGCSITVSYKNTGMTPARSSILTAAGRASTSSECPSRAVTVITAVNVTVHPPARRHQREQAPPPPQDIHRSPAADAQAADHRHHHQPAPARLERPRTRRPARRQTPAHAHPAPRMGPARLLPPHRLRHLPAQHATSRHILDNRTRPLTTRHWLATGEKGRRQAGDNSKIRGRPSADPTARWSWRGAVVSLAAGSCRA